MSASAAWARTLADEVEHHRQEEDTHCFKRAGKLLPERDKTCLARAYREAFDSAKTKA